MFSLKIISGNLNNFWNAGSGYLIDKNTRLYQTKNSTDPNHWYSIGEYLINKVCNVK